MPSPAPTTTCPRPAAHSAPRRRQLLNAGAALAMAAMAAACGGSDGAAAPAPGAGPGPSPGPSPSPSPSPTPAPAPASLLILGNSFTDVQGGLDMHLRHIAASMPTPRTIAITRVWQGGATLEVLRQLPEVQQALQAGGHDVVLLQDDIPEYGGPSVEPFKTQVRWFDAAVRAKGGRTALFMAWAYERLAWVDQASIAQAHREIAAELNLAVAPVGLAFDAARAQQPALELLDTDREHQSLAGMYLAACTVVATLFGESAEGATWWPAGLSASQAGFLQRVAAATALA